MATFKIVTVTLLLSTLVLQLVQAQNMPTPAPGYLAPNCTSYTPPASGKYDCGLACTARCCKSSRINLCLRACKSCCNRCNCVPPSTSGNYEACPCYGSLTTRGNKHKCP